MELIAEIQPYFELLFLLLVGQAVAHCLYGQRLFNATPNWDVINYAFIAALPIYVVTSSLGLSLAEFAVVSFYRFFVAHGKMRESTGLLLGWMFKCIWVALLYHGIIVVTG